jgi:hypothetical protein
LDEKFKARNSARRVLWKWANTKKTIERLENERAYFKGLADDARCMLKAQNLTGMPGGGVAADISDIIVQVEKSSAIYASQCERINEEIADALQIRNMVYNFITKLTPIQEKVITYRYLEGYTWQFIALKINYDEKSARRIETRVVDNLVEHMKVFSAQ